jgi:hypothetical protein
VSTVSATVPSIFGIIFFCDNSELAFGLPNRTFTNRRRKGGNEPFYGGIHYRASIENGMVQGQNIGRIM